MCANLFGRKKRETLEMIKSVAKEMLEAEEEDATVELEILCGTVADLLDDCSDEPGVSGQQVQAQPGMVQQAQNRAERRPWRQSLLNKYPAIQKYVLSVTLNLLDF